ncbi:protein-L-isoaspartate O-methyltransferase [Panaeolus papilionaceus]|nr:protein-L-isoaspartate O-methyltransferase [Panaeolus papilionaceus]
MAWRCTGSSNAVLIQNMKNHGIFHSDKVMHAMGAVDRANYVLRRADAYEDSPQSIGHSATISAPHMHAYATEHLLPYLKPGAKVLDVGSGSGYLAAVLHRLVSPGGKVVGIEHIPELVTWSEENLKKDGLGDALASGEIEMIAGDGREGYAAGGPYDAIHVGAAAPTIPEKLVAQLASPGRMFIPVGDYMQYIEQIDKDEHGNVTSKRVMGVRYVPLTDKDKQLGGWIN